MWEPQPTVAELPRNAQADIHAIGHMAVFKALPASWDQWTTALGQTGLQSNGLAQLSTACPCSQNPSAFPSPIEIAVPSASDLQAICKPDAQCWLEASEEKLQSYGWGIDHGWHISFIAWYRAEIGTHPRRPSLTVPSLDRSRSCSAGADGLDSEA